MGMAACQAAYEAGAGWLEQLKQYLAGNLAYIRQFLREKLPDIALIEPEGTYLVWLDLRKLGLTEQQQTRQIKRLALAGYRNPIWTGRRGI